MFSLHIRSSISSIPFLLLGACSSNTTSQTPLPTSKKTLQHQEAELLALKHSEKYGPEPTLFYPGIADPSLKPIFSQRIDLAVDDFLAIVRSGKPTKESYLDAIREGLGRFAGYELDREDKDRTAGYFEQMMDCVGLENSEGLLNDFAY